jgi:transposase-like protein
MVVVHPRALAHNPDSSEESKMTRPAVRDAMYRGRVVDAAVIEFSVLWYINCRLSYRGLVAMMVERGVEVSHTTILRWVVRYVPEFEKRWHRYARRMGSSWGVDET